VFGGAELLARWFAHHLAEAGHEVDVLTTCALDHTSWRNALPPGVERDGAVTVRRFLVDDREVKVHGELERAVNAGLKLSREEELLWMRNGVASAAMEDELASKGQRYDLVFALPYLFGTTYFAVEACAGRAVLIPCLHDEPYAYLGLMREMFANAGAVMFNSQPESDLGRRLAPGIARSAVVGVGFDPPAGADAAGFLRRHRLGQPLLLYAGRREAGKNVPELIEYFVRYKERRGGDLQLALAGSGDVPLPRRPDVVDLTIDWQTEREALYRAATVVCQPSRNESFSIVLMQAWLAERPVVVHSNGAVTRFHCERSNGGLWYTTYAEFEEVMDRLLADESLRAALGRSGRRFVESEYSWPAVIGRFEQAAYSWVGREAVASEPGRGQ
jgi:glycosyltransferase involved in cell wall biosynthesis